MVRRQLLVQPLHFAMLVVYCQIVDLVDGEHRGISAILITLSCDQGSTESTHDTGDIRADRLTVGDFFKASQYGIVVEGTALYDDMFCQAQRRRKL